jgi:dTDP-4-dehydrorhamnose reductase
MILLLGASGYMGRAFANELRRRGHSFVPLTREAFDYTRFDFLFDYMRNIKPAFLINAAGFCGARDEDASESSREKAMLGNALLPQMIARACLMTRTPWGHVSSGSIYSGAKVLEGDQFRIERDLSRPDLCQLFRSAPDRFRGFTELDEPNFSFRCPPCSFYSGTKALAEEAIRDIGQAYIWRAHHPFSDRDEPCNYLSRLQQESPLEDSINSLSHLEDCVGSCVDLWEMKAPFGIYNVTNPGAVTTRQLIEMMHSALKRNRRPVFSKAHADRIVSAQVPRSNCILDASKLLAAGVKIRNVTEALTEAIERLRLGLRSLRVFRTPSLQPPAASL